jgi:hypothetical protein
MLRAGRVVLLWTTDGGAAGTAAGLSSLRNAHNRLSQTHSNAVSFLANLTTAYN